MVAPTKVIHKSAYKRKQKAQSGKTHITSDLSCNLLPRTEDVRDDTSG